MGRLAALGEAEKEEKMIKFALQLISNRVASIDGTTPASSAPLTKEILKTFVGPAQAEKEDNIQRRWADVLDETWLLQYDGREGRRLSAAFHIINDWVNLLMTE